MAKRFENTEQRPTHEEIAQRAYAIFEANGRTPGQDMENWLQAEAQLSASATQKTETDRKQTETERRPGSNGTAKAAPRPATAHRS